MKVLFICNQNKHRSKTAEELFRGKFETKSAGLYNETPVNENELEGADLIAVMEDFQREELGKRFPKQYMKKRIISLNVPDVYSFNQPELIKILNLKVRTLVEPILQLS
ncbi:MAG: phosphotyrosine protein phosphatase [Candidatus Nanoarchaeia archaeon]|nr:phosphotyrosine protein phosphatase [Candidatus Nanoarchaeia archaeon]